MGRLCYMEGDKKDASDALEMVSWSEWWLCGCIYMWTFIRCTLIIYVLYYLQVIH